MALQQAPPPVVVPGTSFIVKEGWLVKQGGKYKTWKKRWFVLKNNHISYHKEPSKEPVGRITFSIVSSTSVAPDWDKKVKNKSHFRIHVIDGRSGGAFLIGASDEEDMREWMTAINETLEKYRKAGVGLTAIGSDTKVDKEVPDKDSGEPPPPPPEQKKEMAASQDIRKVRRYTSLQGPSRASTSIQRASRLSTAKLILDSNITKKPSTESFSDDEESDDDAAESPEQMSEEGKSKELYQAVATGNIVNVKAWLQLGVDTNWVNESENNRTALHAAVQRNDARIVADLLAANASVNVQDTLGTTPIQIAAAHGNIDSLNALLAAPKVNLSLLDASNRSATYIAIFTGHKECAERLLELEIANGSNQWDSYHLSAVQNVEAFEGYDPEAANEQFVSPLHVASAFGACKSVKWLLSQSTKTRIKDSLQRTPVHYAAASGSVEVLTELIQSGFSADDRDEYGKNALHFAAGLGRTDVVKELLQRECLGAPDNLDFTPLHIACVQGQAECVELLLENNTDDINVESLDSFTPLFLAAHGGNTNVIDCLLSHKANINQRTATNETPIHEACRRGNTQALELLLKHKANAEAIDINGNSPLLTSIRNCSTACTEILLREGADTQIRNNKKESALSIAVEVEDLDTINLLLEQGMDCNETLADGGTILFIAAEKGNKAIVKLLLNCGAEPDAENKAKETPVFKGIAAGHPDIVELLMEVGANPNHKTKSGLTPLLEAARLDRVECLEILLACGALTTARNEQKETALHLAAAVGSVRAMSRLLLFGASLAACNNKRKTPLQVAAENGHKLAALLCIANGASVPPHSLPLMGDLVESLLQSGDKEFSVRKRKDSSAKRRRHKKLKKRSVDSSSKLLASSSGDISAPPEVPDLATPSLDNLPGNTASESVVDSPSPLEDKSEANVSNPPDVPTDAPAISRPDVPAPSPPEADAPEVNAPIPPETDAPAISRPDVPAPSPPEADAPTPPEASAPKPTPVESAVPPVRREPDEPDHVFAKRFMKRAQQVLTKPNYKQFYQLLRQYKEETIQPNELFEKIAEILSSPDTLDLLENFQTFLPDEQKENYARYISSMSGINNS